MSQTIQEDLQQILSSTSKSFELPKAGTSISIRKPRISNHFSSSFRVSWWALLFLAIPAPSLTSFLKATLGLPPIPTSVLGQRHSGQPPPALPHSQLAWLKMILLDRTCPTGIITPMVNHFMSGNKLLVTLPIASSSPQPKYVKVCANSVTAQPSEIKREYGSDELKLEDIGGVTKSQCIFEGGM